MLATTAEAQAIAPLQSTSPCKGAGTDGKDLGANVPGVNAVVAKGKIAQRLFDFSMPRSTDIQGRGALRLGSFSRGYDRPTNVLLTCYY
jgi:hypothetical protein